MISGNPRQGYNQDFSYSLGGINGSKAVAWTNLAYIKYDQAVRDTAKQMEGWLIAQSGPSIRHSPH